MTCRCFCTAPALDLCVHIYHELSALPTFHRVPVMPNCACRWAVWTPSGVVPRTLTLDNFWRTQSGRLVVPPLARWAGQRLQQDEENVSICFDTKAAEEYFISLADDSSNSYVSDCP